MLRLIWNVLKAGTVTQRQSFPDLPEFCLGLPVLQEASRCTAEKCMECSAACPTGAISIGSGGESQENAAVTLDLGSCIACGLCISSCPESVFGRNLSTLTAVQKRSHLVLQSNRPSDSDQSVQASQGKAAPYRKSLAIRVVSTGCSACDMEVAAAGNPIFDMERFGVSVVASPRAADALLVTGPVGQGMREALLRTYEAMAEPRLVIACGTCAISGGMHRGGYADCQGVDAVLPVDVYIPGCPPHPWSIVHGIFLAMGRGAEIVSSLASSNSSRPA